MRACHSNDCAHRRVIWQVCIAALLIGMILYNPFYGLTNPADGFTYQSLARHRATVGASEMQHFTPVQGVEAQPEGTVEGPRARVAAEKKEEPLPRFSEEALPQQLELAASVWFRPPPSK
jgi:hypothetical protein